MLTTDPARILANLIELGYALEPPDNLPLEWRQPYEAVLNARGGREDRMAAFFQATQGNPSSAAMWLDITQAMPARSISEPSQRIQSDRLRIYSAWEALSAPPQLDWCIETLFNRPSLNLIVGDPGSKKTYLALDLAVCVAMGLPWLGLAAHAAPVLIVDEESGLSRLWARLHTALRGHKAERQTPIYFISLPGFDLRSQADTQILIEQVLATNAGLLILDPLAQILHGGDENSALSVLPVFANLRRVSETCNAAILVLHHTNKQGIFRGSTSISASVDHMLAVDSHPESSIIHLHTLKARDLQPVSIVARAHFQPDQFFLLPSDEAPSPKPAQLSAAAFSILQYLSDQGQVTTPALVTALDIGTPGGLRKNVHDLIVSGFISRVDGGGQGKTALLQLTHRGRRLLSSRTGS